MKKVAHELSYRQKCLISFLSFTLEWKFFWDVQKKKKNCQEKWRLFGWFHLSLGMACWMKSGVLSWQTGVNIDIDKWLNKKSVWCTTHIISMKYFNIYRHVWIFPHIPLWYQCNSNVKVITCISYSKKLSQKTKFEETLPYIPLWFIGKPCWVNSRSRDCLLVMIST